MKLQKETDKTYDFEHVVYELKTQGIISEELKAITVQCIHHIKNRIAEAENK